MEGDLKERNLGNNFQTFTTVPTRTIRFENDI
jgi:hypothetical protein